jgi:hypothetical protein
MKQLKTQILTLVWGMGRMIHQTQHSFIKFTIFNKVSQATCFDPRLGHHQAYSEL